VAEAKNLDLLELTKTFLSSDGARELSMQILQQQEETVCPYPGKTTPLHLLSIFNLVEIARELPDMDFMKSDQDGFYFTPLDYALTQGSKEMTVWLLQGVNKTTAASLHCRCALVHQAAIHDWGDVECLLSLEYDGEAKFGEIEATPLHLAASRSSESALTALLKANLNVNLTDRNKTTPLIVAADCNHLQMVTLLLEAGADVNVRGWDSITALHHAARHGELSIAKALFEKGAEVDPVAGEGWGFSTPLHLAAENGYLEVVELLIKRGAEVNKRGPEGYTALLLTCSSGFPACLEHLIKENARIDARNDKKQTCFHLAAMNGYLDVLKILVEKCSDLNLINAVDENGDTPLHSAICNSLKAEAKFLLEHGALTSKTNNLGQSVLQVAIIVGETEIGSLLVDKHKADVRHKDLLSSSALHYAAYSGNCDFIPILLNANADPNAANESLETTLHFAAKRNELKFIKKFLEAVPTLDLAPKNKTKQTPLHIASSEGYLELVDFFVLQQKFLYTS
jgi:ankyrin repeat protein